MLFLILGLCILIILLIIVLLAYITFRLIFFVPTKHQENSYELPKGKQYEQNREVMLALIKEIDDIPCERVYIKAKDGIILSGRYYHQSDNAPLQIQFPGYKGSAIRDFCGGNKLARELGFNVLLVDLRAHGLSNGHTITFGIKERYDCLCWIEYALERFGKTTPIYLAGISMGASTILMASGLNLPENVRGLLADCPYSNPPAIIKKVCCDMKYPTTLFYPFIYLGALIFGHFRLNSASAVDAVRKCQVPILIIHGKDDKMVPYEMSEEIYKNCPKGSKLYLFPNAGHGISYLSDLEKYKAITLEFFKYCEDEYKNKK